MGVETAWQDANLSPILSFRSANYKLFAHLNLDARFFTSREKLHSIAKAGVSAL
jgi:hypothetical protein